MSDKRPVVVIIAHLIGVIEIARTLRMSKSHPSGTVHELSDENTMTNVHCPNAKSSLHRFFNTRIDLGSAKLIAPTVSWRYVREHEIWRERTA